MFKRIDCFTYGIPKQSDNSQLPQRPVSLWSSKLECIRSSICQRVKVRCHIGVFCNFCSLPAESHSKNWRHRCNHSKHSKTNDWMKSLKIVRLRGTHFHGNCIWRAFPFRLDRTPFCLGSRCCPMCTEPHSLFQLTALVCRPIRF